MKRTWCEECCHDVAYRDEYAGDWEGVCDYEGEITIDQSIFDGLGNYYDEEGNRVDCPAYEEKTHEQKEATELPMPMSMFGLSKEKKK
jgi:hypothetical protein